jgi:NADH:ubiquinone oxidoreductase subunit E
MNKRIRVQVCAGTSCHLMGNSQILTCIEELPRTIRELIDVSFVSCFGECAHGPRVNVDDELIYNATPDKVIEAIKNRAAKSKGR